MDLDWEPEVASFAVEARGGRGRLRPLRTGDGSDIVALAFGPDGATLVSAGEDHLVRRWDIARREQRGAPLAVHGVKSVALGPASSVLAAIGDGHGVRLWDASTGRELRQGPRDLGPPRRSWRLALSSGGNVLAMAGGAQTVLGTPRDTGASACCAATPDPGPGRARE